jgi:predicted XRE-type DNA-binding protein
MSGYRRTSKIVTANNVDYGRHKEDVRQVILEKTGSVEKTNKFMNTYMSRYDEYGRSYIDYKLALNLMQDIKHCQKIGTRFYAIVGDGGTGKSTLLKNILYFFDPQFNDRTFTNNLDSFVDILDSLPETNALRSVGMDEPDDSYHISSVKGKQLRKIFGKIRQQKLWIGFCATDLKDIPPYIFRKINVIIFLPHQGKGFLFRNAPLKKYFPIQKIRSEYSSKGYQMFYDLPFVLEFRTHKDSPFDLKFGQRYLETKAADYKKDLGDFKHEALARSAQLTSERNKIINLLLNKGMKQQEVATLFNISTQRITQIKRESKVKAPNTILPLKSSENQVLGAKAS